MGKRLEALTPTLTEFIEAQPVFFVGTARREGSVNVSPKGMNTLRVLSPNKVVWLNLTGSGNETATHLLESDRMTIMFCSFEEKPLILRLYGKAKVYHPSERGFDQHAEAFPKYLGTRQIIELNIQLVQTSCGFAVPFMELKGERPMLKRWAEKKGQEKIEAYWEEKNAVSLDGHSTDILK